MTWLQAVETTAARLPLTIAYRRDLILTTRSARYDSVITELAILRSIRDGNRAQRYRDWVRQSETPWTVPTTVLPVNAILPSFPSTRNDFDPVEESLIIAATNYALVDVFVGIQNMREMSGTVPPAVLAALSTSNNGGTGVFATGQSFSDVYDWVDGFGHNLVSSTPPPTTNDAD